MSSEYPAPGPGDQQQPHHPLPSGGQYGQSYGQAPEGYPPYGPAKTSPMAVTALVLGIVGLLCFTAYLVGIAAVVTGVVARKQVAGSHGTLRGSGMALTGIVLGAVAILAATVYWVLVATGALDVDALLRG